MAKLNRSQISSLDDIINNIVMSLKNYIEGTEKVNDSGLEYNLYSLIYLISGSVDYFNKVLMNETYTDSDSPLSLTPIKDHIQWGFINSEIIKIQTTDNTIQDRKDYRNQLIESEIYWDINNPPPIPFYYYGDTSSPSEMTYAATTDVVAYPSWNGWPTYSHLSIEDKYPKNYSSQRIPVFLCSKYFTLQNDDVSDIVYDNTFEIEIPQALRFSMWKNNYDDIRIFRCSSYNNSYPILADPIENTYVEVPSFITDNKIIFQVAQDIETGFVISPGNKEIYIAYWCSYDAGTEALTTLYPKPVLSSENEFSGDYTIESGNYFNYFYDQRTDYTIFEKSRKLIKLPNKTNYETYEQDEDLYIPLDPEFYIMHDMHYHFDNASYIFPPNYGNALSVNDSLEYDSVYGITVSIKTYADVQANYVTSVNYSYERGPQVYSDGFPEKWEDFEYFPSAPNEYKSFINIIVGAKKSTEKSCETPVGNIVYINFTKPYAREQIISIDLASQLSSIINVLNNNLLSFLPRIAIANYIFGMYFTFIAQQISQMILSENYFSIFESHEKYSTAGFIGNEDIIKKERETITAVDYDRNSTLETIATDFSIQPWYKNLLYWRHPTDYEDEHFNFKDGTNWLFSTARGLDTSRTLLNYCPGDANYDDTIPIYNPSDPYTTKQKRDDPLQCGLNIISNENINASTLEVYFPQKTILTEDFHSFKSSDIYKDSLNQDYTFKLYMRDKNNNKISKEFFLSNANYWVTDYEYSVKQELHEEDPYLCPATINSKREYREYKDAALIPDCMNGSSYKIYTRVFDPDSTGNLTREDHYNLLIAQYNPYGKTGRDREIAFEYINDAMEDYENTIGYETIDERTISNQFTKIEEAWLATTNYVYNSDPIWKNVYEYNDDYVETPLGIKKLGEIGVEQFKTRYGFKTNNSWYYQSFTQEEVITSRTEYIDTHIQSEQVAKLQDNYSLFNDVDFALNGTNSQLAQTFTADFANVSRGISEINLWLQRVGNDERISFQVKIYTLSDNRPDELISSSNRVLFDSISTDGEWIQFYFSPYPKLTENERYAIILSTFENSYGLLTTENYLRWRFSNLNNYTYGISTTITYTAETTIVGMNSIIVSSREGFPESSFFVVIDGLLYYITTITEIDGKIHFMLGEYEYPDYSGQLPSEYPEYTWYIQTVTEAITSGTLVSLVNFMPYDTENRFYKQYTSEYGIDEGDWELPLYSNHDCAYSIVVEPDIISPVEIVRYSEWAGDDIDNSGLHDFLRLEETAPLIEYSDSFFIVSESSTYIPSDSEIYSYVPKETLPISGHVFGGFNTSAFPGFPLRNDVRLTDKNKLDSYWALNTQNLSISERIKILPHAVIATDGSCTYIPFYNNMYLTIGLRRDNNSRKVFNKFIVGYVHDFGIIDELLSPTKISLTSSILNSPNYPGEWTSVEEIRFAYKELIIVDGDAENSEGIRITICSDATPGDSTYEIELLTAMNVSPNPGDQYFIRYSEEQSKAEYYCLITEDPEIDEDTGYTILEDDTQNWTEDLSGYYMWAINSNEVKEIVSNTLTTITFANLDVAPEKDEHFFILNPNESPDTFFGTKEPIIIDDEKFVGVDHIYISSSNFPSDYYDGMGYMDAFMIRGNVNVTR
jgi:hypothetical protein